MKIKSNNYYRKFSYRIEKKITVEDSKAMKNYAKLGLYVYIIHDIQDNNRFVYITTKHHESDSLINPYSCKFYSIDSQKYSIYLKKNINRFKQEYFTLTKSMSDIKLKLIDITGMKSKSGYVFSKYKTHSKKIAIDYPNWYIELIKKTNIKSHKKNFMKKVLIGNEYNDSIKEHYISTLYKLNSHYLQLYNDHSIILDEGKTGKSSLIGFGNSKVDNISIAGLYGSSNSMKGKFQHGLISKTDNTLIIDEVNELAENSKYEKILSVLNTMLENGSYNYQKQFSHEITASNQFYFIGNIGDSFNLDTFMHVLLGNTTTFGRRIGVITYSDNLNGYKQGGIRTTPTPYIKSISMFLSNVLNNILSNNKFIKKLNNQKQFIALENDYKRKLKKIINENNLSKNINAFIKSHSGATKRIFIRGLKLYLFENLDELINGDMKIYDNKMIYNCLGKVKYVMSQNIMMINNVVEHVKNYNISDNNIKYNKKNFDNICKTHKNFIYVFYKNKDKVSGKGSNYNKLNDISEIKRAIYEIKNGRSKITKINKTLFYYGCKLCIENKDIVFRIINQYAFENKLIPIFEKKINEIDNIKKENIDIDDDLI